MAKPKAWLSWSSGKDSAWALAVTRQRNAVEITGLLTTVNTEYGRVAMHAVRESLLRAQAASAGVPLITVPIPTPCSNAEYESAMNQAMKRALAEDVEHVIFGDIFLEDVRRYREEKLAPTGIIPLFPLWNRNADELAREMIGAGIEAVVTCIDPQKLERKFAGRLYDSQFLGDLPPGVDPCGENGEFHTFAYAGPMFRAPIPFVKGEVVERDGFVFADVLPAAQQ